MASTDQHVLASSNSSIVPFPLPSGKTRIAGDSPFYYVSDPVNHALKIVRMYVRPNPPGQGDEDTRNEVLRVTLWGELGTAFGDGAKCKMTLSRNGTYWRGPEISDLGDGRTLIYQEGHQPIVRGKRQQELFEGPVQITASIPPPVAFYQKGFYSVNVEIWAKNGRTLTHIEGTAWMDGRDEDFTGLD